MANVYNEPYRQMSGDLAVLSYCLQPCDWEENEDEDYCGFGPFDSKQAAKDWAACHLPHTNFVLIAMEHPSAPQREEKA